MARRMHTWRGCLGVTRVGFPFHATLAPPTCLALALLLLCAACAWRPAGQPLSSAPGVAAKQAPGAIAVRLSLAPRGRKLQFNGGTGALQNDFAHLVVGIFDNGNVASPSLGYLYRGAGGLVAGTVEALTAGGASWLLAPGEGIADKLGSAGTGASPSGLAITGDKANLRRYLIRHFGDGAAFVGGTTEVRFSNLPAADGARHAYLVFAAAYDGADTNLGYTEAAVADNLSQGGSDAAAAQLTLELKQAVFTNELAATPALVPFVPGASSPWTVGTLAGAGDFGNANGLGASASFNYPSGLAGIPGEGGAYVADYSNHRIRRVAPNGLVTTVAGDGNPGFTDGAAASARFNNPYGLALDAAGNLYVGDQDSNRIRKITPGGVVSTVVGDGTPASNDGIGLAAQVNGPRGLAFDAAGNLYVAETRGNRIRKVAIDWTVTTVAGDGTRGFSDGPGASARFDAPAKVVVTPGGLIYVADIFNHAIRVIDQSGTVSTLAGSGRNPGFADGQGTAARFNEPHGLVLDAAGNLLVADFRNHRIRRVTPGGAVTTIAGSDSPGRGDGPVASATFFNPIGLALDGRGVLFVADHSNHLIRVIQ